ncbi:MAG: hypothetical protein HC806_08435 [Anaerolineae bacterium]|nr:hypothetical protein [Anaerolineae bacterium]
MNAKIMCESNPMGGTVSEIVTNFRTASPLKIRSFPMGAPTAGGITDLTTRYGSPTSVMLNRETMALSVF